MSPHQLISYVFDSKRHLKANYRRCKTCHHSSFRVIRWLEPIPRWLMQIQNACAFSALSEWHPSTEFPHPIGIVIGDGVVVEEGCTIWQNVTLGSHGKIGEVMAYPRVGRNVRIYCNATIIGGISVGENSVVGANSVVTTSVPANSVVVGSPARVVRTLDVDQTVGCQA